MRILIAGVPRAGKTSFAQMLGELHEVKVRATDDLISTHDWSEASAEAARWLDATTPWIVEGVAVPRAIRKWLALHETGAPADVVLWFATPRVQLTTGQETMAKGCVTVWSQVRVELEKRGVRVVDVRGGS